MPHLPFSPAPLIRTAALALAAAASLASQSADAQQQRRPNIVFLFSDDHAAHAISAYRRVSEEFGDQNKAPDAMYKLGLALSRTGDLALARTTLEQVVERYPYSTASASAKAELARIKY